MVRPPLRSNPRQNMDVAKDEGEKERKIEIVLFLSRCIIT
jgi:hypothetical protein